ncbi:MAG: alpha/beta fold hydrolase [Pyrinomonadaceae bacterium]
MHVERYGSGARVFFGLHGWGADHHALAPVANRVPESGSFYSADLPGCGQSPAPRDWQLSLVVDEIVEAIEASDANQITLLGNCSGANLALMAARKNGARIGRLVLIDMFAAMPGYFKLFTAKSYVRYAYYSAFANPVGRWMANQSLRSHRTGGTDLTGSFVAVDHEAAYHYLLMLAESGAIEQFRDLNMPIDIVYGERTFGAVKRAVSQWRALWPHARVHELKGAGHLPFAEAPEQLCEIIFEEKGKF